MDIPADILERLAILGENPARFSEIYKKRGADFLRFLVKSLEEKDGLFRQWAPKLRKFAADCRLNNPCPILETLTDRERAKLPIYEAKITKAERLRPRNDKGIIICSLPLIGIPVAQSFWPGEDSLSVMLTPEELSQWYNIYKHPEDVSQWWIDYWWKIEDPPDPNSILNRDRDLKVPAGESPWLVHSGLCWGPLAGGSTTELWSWDGKEARFVRIFHSLVF